MKFITDMKFWLPMLLCAFLVSCDPNTNQEASRDFSDFSNWVNQNAERAPMLTDEEWNDLDAEFESRSAELEAESDKWDEQTRNQWQELKNKWADAERQVQESDQRVDAVDADLDMDTVNRE